MRHLREVGPDAPARDVLAEPNRERRPVGGRIGEDVAEGDDLPPLVRDPAAPGLLARAWRLDADVGRGERVGEVVLQVRDLSALDAGGEAELVAGDVRPGDR